MSLSLWSVVRVSFCAVFVAAASSTPLQAAGFWLPTGDTRLRSDVMLLADEGVIQLPVNAWPIPVEEVARPLARVQVETLGEPALQAAYLRVSGIIEQLTRDTAGAQEIRVTGGRASLLRDYGSLAREEGELMVRTTAGIAPWSVNLALTAVTSPEDGKSLRFDESEISGRAGNWILSVNAMSRWWGPGHDGSLILSNNARPMPGVSLDRVRTTPFSYPILRWLGPWRFSALLSAMEGSRPDVDSPVFMAMRLSFQPARILEVGLSRSAQFCGNDRPCDLATFGRVLFGRDNAGIRVSFADEPGNQMAGADFRLTSPFRSLPVALYAQLIGEDSSSSTIPEKYLAIFGIDGWSLLDNGSVLRGHVEYSNTSCSYFREQPYADCGYRQGIFRAGYRYRGRTIGHTSDSDSEMTAVGLTLMTPSGQQWGLSGRTAKLDRFGGPDIYDPVTLGPSKYKSVELSWSGTIVGQALRAQLGAQSKKPAGGESTQEAYGYLSWSRRLQFN